jgi:ppGpp synthetase/RelA/SpoT-type nucleotidyltranferase
MAAQPLGRESLVPLFMNQYDYKENQKLAERLAELCSQALLKKGISHRTEWRGKATQSLQDKLEKRERERGQFRTPEEIQDEMFDLVGARIILDRWEDRHLVKDVLNETFKVRRDKEMKRENGYQAVHYHVCLQQSQYASDVHKTEAWTLAEIQVSFHGMWQWGKIEHSNVYKPTRETSPELAYSLDMQVRLATWHEEAAQHSRKVIAQGDAAHKEMLAKARERITDAGSVGSHLNKWVAKHDMDWARDESESLGSATALMKFLDSREWRTAECLDRLLRKHLGDGAQDKYFEAAKYYDPIKMNLILYLLDCEVLRYGEHELLDFQALDSHEDHLRKIRVILSTLIWMDRLFSPTYEWQRLLARLEDQNITRPGILWLANSSRQHDFEKGTFLTPDDIVELTSLWKWFSGNRDRPVRLAFGMSKQGATRDFSKENENKDLKSVLEPLTQALGRREC